MGATGTGKDIVTRIISSALLHGVYDDRITPGVRASVRQMGIQILEGIPEGPFTKTALIIDDLEEVNAACITEAPGFVFTNPTAYLQPTPEVRYEPLNGWSILIHPILFWVTVWISWPFSILFALFTPRQQMLHDLVVGTLMLRRSPMQRFWRSGGMHSA